MQAPQQRDRHSQAQACLAERFEERRCQQGAADHAKHEQDVAQMDRQVDGVIAPWFQPAQRIVEGEQEIRNQADMDHLVEILILRNIMLKDAQRPECPDRRVVYDQQAIIERELASKDVRIGKQHGNRQQRQCRQKNAQPQGVLPGRLLNFVLYGRGVLHRRKTYRIAPDASRDGSARLQ